MRAKEISIQHFSIMTLSDLKIYVLIEAFDVIIFVSKRFLYFKKEKKLTNV